MTEQDKKIINYKNNVSYYDYKIKNNIKFIDLLLKENRIYKKILDDYSKKLDDIYYLSSEEIEVLNE